MIELSKVRDSDDEILVFDKRPATICRDIGTEPLVLLGRITPRRNGEIFRWESRWGGSCGELPALELARSMIVACAVGMYR